MTLLLHYPIMAVIKFLNCKINLFTLISLGFIMVGRYNGIFKTIYTTLHVDSVYHSEVIMYESRYDEEFSCQLTDIYG